MISKESVIYIAGQQGMIGSAIWRQLSEQGYIPKNWSSLKVGILQKKMKL